MEAAHLLAFNAALVVAIASPGPSLMFLARTAMAEGRAAGLAAAAGLALMAALWTGAALVGLAAVFEIVPWAYAAAKAIGAAYLVWIAAQTWRHARAPMPEAAPGARGRAFRRGVLVNLANPKSVLFAGAVIVVIFPPGLGATDKLVIFANHLAVEMVLQPALALLLSAPAVRGAYGRAKAALDRAAAVVLGGLGLRILTQP